MQTFTLHTPRTAPSRGARAALREVVRQRGAVPNLHAALALSEPSLRGYIALGEQLALVQLTTLERQVVMMEANRFHEASYCVAAHSAVAHAIGMPADWLRALREGQPLPDGRMEALRRFTSRVLERRGAAEPADWLPFQAAGYQAEHALEVILIIAAKTLSNFASRLARLPDDVGLQPWAWAAAPTPDGETSHER
jgi:alkylhydroperoxidase family enzyme